MQVVQTGSTSAHNVQFFDTTESLVETVAGFLADGFDRDETLLVAATANHWLLTSQQLTARGYDVAGAATSGRLTVVDAGRTLAQFMRQTRPEPILFQGAVGSLVQRLTSTRSTNLRIYGEMVDVLVEEGNFAGAQQLEELWNALAARCNFFLFCGYSSTHFGDPRHGAALRAICQAHTGVHTHPKDELGAFLVNHQFSHRPQPHDSVADPIQNPA